MGYVSDLEDIHSVCLTVLQKLLDDYNIDPATIGRLYGAARAQGAVPGGGAAETVPCFLRVAS